MKNVPQAAPYYSTHCLHQRCTTSTSKRWFSNNPDGERSDPLTAPTTSSTDEGPSSLTEVSGAESESSKDSSTASTESSTTESSSFTTTTTTSTSTTTTIEWTRNEHKDEGPLGIVEILSGTKIQGHGPTAKSGKTWEVNHLRYSSPQRGLQCICILIGSTQEQKKQLPVKKQGERWEWVSPPGPPPHWIYQQGIPYDLEEAKKHRHGRPYGFSLKLWNYMKNNFARHADAGQVFPDDFIRTPEQIAQRKLEAKQRSKENLRRQAELSKQIKQRKRQERQQLHQQQQNNVQSLEVDKPLATKAKSKSKAKSRYPQSNKMRQTPNPKSKQRSPQAQTPKQPSR